MEKGDEKMKYLDVIFVVMMINLSLSLIDATGLFPNTDELLDVESISPTDGDGNILEGESLAYKVQKFDNGKFYTNAAGQNLNQQYLQSGGDFFRGLYWFWEAFGKGSIMVHTTLQNFHVAPIIIFFIVTPIYFLYALAIVYFVSGRSLGDN